MITIYYYQDSGKIHSVVDMNARYGGVSQEMRKQGIAACRLTRKQEAEYNQNWHFIEIENGRLSKFNEKVPTVAPLHSTIIPKGIKTIIIERDEKGLGDAVSTISAVQSLRKVHHSAKIIYRGKKEWISILKHHPCIDEIQDVNAPRAQAGGTTQQLVNAEESPASVTIRLGKPCPCGEYENAKGNTIDRSRNEIFTLTAGMSWNDERPVLYLTKEEIRWGHSFTQQYRNSNGRGAAKSPFLGVALKSAEIWKDWKHTLEFIKQANEEYMVFAIDQKMETGLKGVVDTAKYALSIRQVMSILPYMDCVVSPDTGIFHLCDALDVPCIALFGSMNSNVHQEKYDSSVSFIQGQCIFGIPPCMYQVCNGKGNYQPCMDSISPNSVLEAVKKKIAYGTIDRIPEED